MEGFEKGVVEVGGCWKEGVMDGNSRTTVVGRSWVASNSWAAIGGKSAVRGYKYARDMLDDRTDSGSAIVSDEERLVGGASRSMTQVVGDMSMFAIVLDLASLRRLLIAVFILSSLPCYRCLDLGTISDLALDTQTFTIEVTFVVIRLEPNGNIASRMDRLEYMRKSPCIYGISNMGNDMRGDSTRGRKENGGECAKIDIDLWFNVALPIVSGQCTNALGMESGEIPNEDITASSMYDPSLGPKHARLRQDKGGGAWCPKNMVTKEGKEYLEVNLHSPRVLMSVRTQGRFGNGHGVEYTEEYFVEYWRPGFNKWVRWRNRRGTENPASCVQSDGPSSSRT
ncbi:hypothetical protein HZH66_010105 [Vespula vulgaris]|uniref:F5/8 type C domain-containing protein n=1 Tax=Vespula vulgaris TaxID=7454 RepID=A0A834MZU1_VESVU|nr:hypothetical protein HZH66_010105 [Vespula vulgaris]